MFCSDDRDKIRIFYRLYKGLGYSARRETGAEIYIAFFANKRLGCSRDRLRLRLHLTQRPY